MKLLLTSNGLCNKTIADQFIKMIGKPIDEAVIAFIPTAANIVSGDKKWLVDDLYNIAKLEPKVLDIVDISTLPKELWLPRLESVDVLFFSGGNSYYLMYWIMKSGLQKLLPGLLHNKLYAGISAGSIVATKSLLFSSDNKKDLVKKYYNYDSEESLSFVDFYVRPHFNEKDFPHAQENFIKEKAEKISDRVYAIDNESAISYIDGRLDIISVGEWHKYN